MRTNKISIHVHVEVNPLKGTTTFTFTNNADGEVLHQYTFDDVFSERKIVRLVRQFQSHLEEILNHEI